VFSTLGSLFGFMNWFYFKRLIVFQ
jgi:hypothetical protein